MRWSIVTGRHSPGCQGRADDSQSWGDDGREGKLMDLRDVRQIDSTGLGAGLDMKGGGGGDMENDVPKGTRMAHGLR